MVKIVTQNVRGLRNELKRRGMFQHLCNKGDIICMQETHSNKNDEIFWQNEWGGNVSGHMELILAEVQRFV